jgi:hypothetical protein
MILLVLQNPEKGLLVNDASRPLEAMDERTSTVQQKNGALGDS